MDRLQVAFAALVVLSLSLGGITAVDVRDRLRAVEAVEMVQQRVDVTVTDVVLREDALVVTVRLQNPTRLGLSVQGVRMRVHNESDARIASGAGFRVDDHGSVLPAGGELTVTYGVRLSEADHRKVRAALARDATLSMNFAVELGETSFVLRSSAAVSEGR